MSELTKAMPIQDRIAAFHRDVSESIARNFPEITTYPNAKAEVVFDSALRYSVDLIFPDDFFKESDPANAQVPGTPPE